MKKKCPFQGSIVALVTPFNSRGEIDEKALEALIERQIREGTDGLVVFGTTGEASTLSEEEKCHLMDLCLFFAKGRCFIIAGTGTNDTKKSILLTEKAQEKGVQGALIIIPYYNRPTQEGVIAHFREIAKIGLPLIVYHHPGRTGVTLQPETFAKLSEISNIVAVKESSGEMSILKGIRSKSSLPIICGDDFISIEAFHEGAEGMVSVIGNLVPKEWKSLISLCKEENFLEARKIEQSFYPLIESIFLETSPQGVKYALSLMGFCSSQLRLPLLEPSSLVKEKIQSSLKDLRLI